jgi:uncharacterized protein (TIGR03435 family)
VVSKLFVRRIDLRTAIAGNVGVAAALLIAITALGGFGEQTPPRFEVASVKPSQNRNFLGVDARAGGRMMANGPLALLVANAYGMKHFQILGGPKWINYDLYSIEAKAEGRLSRAGMMQALQALLEDRFKLSVDRQTRELGVYVLTVGKSGMKREVLSAGGCPARDASTEPGPPRPGQRPCGGVTIMGLGGRVRLEGRGATIEQLLERLSNFVDRPIIDRTGYVGTLDFALEFAPEWSVAGPFALAVAPHPMPSEAPASETPASDENATTSLASAFREKMGLELKSGKGPVPVMTIRHVERPSAN